MRSPGRQAQAASAEGSRDTGSTRQLGPGAGGRSMPGLQSALAGRPPDSGRILAPLPQCERSSVAAAAPAAAAAAAAVRNMTAGGLRPPLY